MKLTVWGARGSIPVSGPEFLRYGGDTTCLEVQTRKGYTLILDAGSGLRRLGNELRHRECRECAFVLTHAHWDHLIGFPFFKPLYQSNMTIDFFGCTYAQESVKAILQHTMRPPLFPVDLSEVAAELQFHEDNASRFEVGGLWVERIPLNHPNRGCGFVLTEGKTRVAFFPDNELGLLHEGGLSRHVYAEKLAGVDVMLHDGEYLPEEYEDYALGWGHSTYVDAVHLANEAQAGRLVLWHLNQDRSDQDADRMLERAREEVAAVGYGGTCHIAFTGMQIQC